MSLGLCELGAAPPVPRSRGLGVAVGSCGSNSYLAFQSTLRAAVSPADGQLAPSDLGC